VERYYSPLIFGKSYALLQVSSASGGLIANHTEIVVHDNVLRGIGQLGAIRILTLSRFSVQGNIIRGTADFNDETDTVGVNASAICLDGELSQGIVANNLISGYHKGVGSAEPGGSISDVEISENLFNITQTVGGNGVFQWASPTTISRLRLLNNKVLGGSNSGILFAVFTTLTNIDVDIIGNDWSGSGFPTAPPVGLVSGASLASTCRVWGNRSTGRPLITEGLGSPEGVVPAPIGSLFIRTDGAASTVLYVKESGAGNTGWMAK
jgi:hypothetical protein